MNFLDDPVAKNPPANAGDTGSIPGPGRSHMPRATKPVHHDYVEKIYFYALSSSNTYIMIVQNATSLSKSQSIKYINRGKLASNKNILHNT